MVGTLTARRRVVAAILAALALSAPAAASESSNAGQAADLLAFIRTLEASQGYDDYERRIPLSPPAPLTRMTIADVLDWQRDVRRAGGVSTAAGAYQLIHDTLKDLVDQHGIDPTTPFDAPTQDRFALLLLTRCGPRPRIHDTSQHPAFANCLAHIWAALPLVSGPHKGRSAYHGIADNRSHASPAQVLSLLAGKPVRTSPRGHHASARRAIPDTERFIVYRLVSAEVQHAGGVTTWSIDPYASQ